MSDKKSTKLTIREDRATAIASPSFGSIGALGFNVLFIASRNPKLAVEIMELYVAAHKITADAPQVPEEDFALFANKVLKELKNSGEE